MLNRHTINGSTMFGVSADCANADHPAAIGRVDLGASVRQRLGKRLEQVKRHVACAAGRCMHLPWLRTPMVATVELPAAAWSALVVRRALSC